MADNNPVAGVAKAGASVSGVWGIALIVLGMLCIAAPFVAGTFASMMIAVSLLASGVVIIMGAMQSGSWGTGIFGMLMGIVTALAGVYMLAHPMVLLVSITLFLAFYFIVDGAFQIICAVQAKPADGWVWFLFGGVVSMALGYMIYSNWPFSGSWLVGTLVGIRLLFGGFTLMMLSGAQAAVASAVENP